MCSSLLERLENILETSVQVKVNKAQVSILIYACNYLRLYIGIWCSRWSEEVLRTHSDVLAQLNWSLSKVLGLISTCCYLDGIDKQLLYAAAENSGDFEAILEELTVHIDFMKAALDGDGELITSLRKNAWETAKTWRRELKDAAAADRMRLLELVGSTLDEDNSAASSIDWINPAKLRLEEGRILGQGSFGIVFEAGWAGHRVAIKKFSKELSIGSPWEGEVMAKLRPGHPAVLKVLGWTESEDHVFLVMELMQQSLAKLIGGLASAPILVIVEIMLQIAQGMNYVHTKGIVHRDLKPGNVLINYEGSIEDGSIYNLVAKVCDFGVSKMDFTSNNYHTHLKGTLSYMAPEMLAGDFLTKSHYERSVDVYSFGIMCAEILSANRPFPAGLNRHNLLAQVQSGLRPMLPVNTPQAVKNIIKQCWDADPQKRPTFQSICNSLWSLKGDLLTGRAYRMPDAQVTVSGKLMVGEKLTGQGRFVTDTEWSVCYWVRHYKDGTTVRLSPTTVVNTSEERPQLVLTASDLDTRIELVCVTLNNKNMQHSTTSCSAFGGYGGFVECSDFYKVKTCTHYVVRVEGRKLKGEAKLKISSSGFRLWKRACCFSPSIKERYATGGVKVEVPSDGSSHCVIQGHRGLYRLEFENSKMRDLAVLTMKSLHKPPNP